MLDPHDGIATTSVGDCDAIIQTNGVRLRFLSQACIMLTRSTRPRVILVEDHGMLAGLVTVKDVLRFIATENFDHSPSFDERGGLDGLLEDSGVSRWIAGAVRWAESWSNRFRRG